MGNMNATYAQKTAWFSVALSSTYATIYSLLSAGQIARLTALQGDVMTGAISIQATIIPHASIDVYISDLAVPGNDKRTITAASTVPVSIASLAVLRNTYIASASGTPSVIIEVAVI